jgi:hypothetical protein
MKLNISSVKPPVKLTLNLPGDVAELLTDYTDMVTEQEGMKIKKATIAEKILEYALTNDRDLKRWQRARDETPEEAEEAEAEEASQVESSEPTEAEADEPTEENTAPDHAHVNA